MIKKSTYIRKFTPKQVQLMEQLQVQNKQLKTVPDILFFALERSVELEKDLARIKRFNEIKQAKIELLNNELCQYSTKKNPV